MSDAGLTGPPKPRRAFRVGVVGHRLDRLPQDAEQLKILSQTLHMILGEVRTALAATDRESFASFYTNEAPILRAVSPLAEGSDRLFADAALSLGYELCCPMPFYQEEFEKDFTGKDSKEENSLAHFRGILDKAREGAGLTIFELDGDRAHAPEAYGAAGRVVLNQSDLLVAVWDGDKARGAGGTVDTLHEALRYHVPVICIDAVRPDQCRLLRARVDLTGGADRLSETHIAHAHLPEVVTSIVYRELRPPSADRNDATPASASGFRGRLAAAASLSWLASRQDSVGAEAYFAEQRPDTDRGFLWKLLRNIVADGSLRWPSMSIADFENQIRREWPIFADAGPRPSPVADWANDRLRVFFAWADGLADHYANAHRGAFIASYLLAAFAVLVALLPVTVPPGALANWRRAIEIILGVVEVIALWRILWLQMKSRRQWHERWTDYRLLAELIRELRFMVPLGGGRPLPRIPPHLEVYGDPAQTWMYWYVRAIARQTGIPAARVTPDYMRDCVEFLDRVVGDAETGQRGFHVRAERRARNLDERLRWAANALFILTLLGVSFRVLLALSLHEPEPSAAELCYWLLARCLLVAAAVLPAFGAAVEGINNQGEFVRIAKRSAAMAGAFRRFSARIAIFQKGQPPRLADIVPLSGNIAETMIAEVVDWRAVIIDRQL